MNFEIAAAEQRERVAAALEAVLEHHPEVETGVDLGYGRKEPDYCPTCSEYYPCPTVQAITAAIGDDDD